MKFSGTTSIRTKLVLLITGITVATLSLVFIMYAVGETRNLRKLLQEKTILAAKTAAEFVTTDLTFKDKLAASKTLKILHATPNTTHSAIYAADRSLFVSYGQASSDMQKLAWEDKIKYTTETLIVREPIFHQHKVIGSIVIEVSTEQLKQQVTDFILTAAFILLCMILFAALLANHFQRIISTPILDLTSTIKQVTETGNYTIQTIKHSDDELGVLSENINLLLASLEHRKIQRDRAERALQQERNKLKKNVYERTAELEIAIKELQAFSYSVSHDLRAPLRSIDGFSNILLDDYHDQLDEQGKEYLSRIRNATRRMGEIIDDLLMLSRISRSDLDLIDVDITELCHTIVDRMQGMREKPREIEIHIQENMYLYADRKLITIAFENLISNAWKYTEKKAQAWIKISATIEDGQCTICIQDNGSGFDMTHANKLFTPLQRLHSSNEFEGTGIGLAIVDRIVSKHSASITGKGVVNKGATFCMTFWDRAHDGELD